VALVLAEALVVWAWEEEVEEVERAVAAEMALVWALVQVQALVLVQAREQRQSSRLAPPG